MLAQMPAVYEKNCYALETLTTCYSAVNIADHDNDIMTGILFCSHHPALSKGQKRAYKVWDKSFRACVPNVEESNELTHFFPCNDLANVIFLTERHGIFSTHDMERTACTRVVYSMTKYGHGAASTFVRRNVVPLICEKLAKTSTSLSELSTKEIGIYNTPEGQVYQKSDLESNKNSNQSKGRGTEDQRWEEQVRLELEKKKQAEEAAKRAKAGKLDPMVEKKLKEEGDVRIGIQKEVNIALYGMRVTQTMAASDGAFVYQNVSALLGACHGFLDLKASFKLLYETAAATLLDLVKCTEEPIGDDLFRETSFLFYLATRNINLSDNLAMPLLVPDGITGVDAASLVIDAVYERWLSAPENMKIFFTAGTLEIFLPILSHVAESSSVSGKVRSKALTLSTAHIMLNGLPARSRLMIMKTALHLLNVAQGMSPSPVETLKVLCASGPGVFTQEEFDCICGDSGLLSLTSHVRKGALTAMAELNDNSEFNTNTKYLLRLWLAQFDADKDNLEFAEDMWGDMFGDDDEGVLPSADFDTHFLELMCHKERFIQRMAADALSGAMGVHSDGIENILQQLLELYRSKAPLSEKEEKEKKTLAGKPKFAEARSKKKEIDPNIAIFAGTRGAIGRVFGAAGDEEVFSLDNVESAFAFLIDTGLRDVDSYVRQEMTNSGMRLVTQYGKDASDRFLRIFEVALGKAEVAEKSKGLTEAEYLLYDHQREGVIVFMGTIAKYMDPQNPKLPTIITTLMQALRTPSEDVQLAVAGCFPAIMKLEKKRIGNDGGKHVVETLLDRVLNDETYGERRGASHGLAAAVKGLGIPVLTTFSVIPKLKDAAGNRKNLNTDKERCFALSAYALHWGCYLNLL